MNCNIDRNNDRIERLIKELDSLSAGYCNQLTGALRSSEKSNYLIGCLDAMSLVQDAVYDIFLRE